MEATTTATQITKVTTTAEQITIYQLATELHNLGMQLSFYSKELTDKNRELDIRQLKAQTFEEMNNQLRHSILRLEREEEVSKREIEDLKCVVEALKQEAEIKDACIQTQMQCLDRLQQLERNQFQLPPVQQSPHQTTLPPMNYLANWPNQSTLLEKEEDYSGAESLAGE